jgi:flagellar motor switch protein FliN
MAEKTDLDLRNLNEQGAGGGRAVTPVDGSEAPRTAQDLEAVYDIPVQVSAVLGRATMEVSQLLKLGRGAVVELDRRVGEAIDIYVNNRLVARGEVVVVEDRLGVTMTEIVKGDRG